MQYELISPRDKSKSAIEQVLNNRGITDIQHYLNTSADDVNSPLLLNNLERGAKILVSHIAAGDLAYIQIDPDVDGLSSSALLLSYLNRLFPSYAKTKISYGQHSGKQHGIELDLIPKNVKLVIVPDAGTNDTEQFAELTSQGVDILVLDHHLPDGKLSNLACVINNQIGEYPNRTLSGVGVVYKFCCYLDSLLEVNYADKYLDLVAVGAVADMVPLLDYETRYLVDKGLTQIRNPLISALCERNSYQIGGDITPFAIAFYVAPYLNAVVRVGTMEEKELVFESMLDFKAFEQIPSTKRGCKGQFETRVEQACRSCVNIKNRQTKTRDASLNEIEEIIRNQNLLENKVLLVKLAEAQKTNLTGLLANQEMAKYKRPVLILSPVDVGNGEINWEGSVRGPSNTVESWKDFFENTGLTNFVQGHSHAFGISIADEKVMPFINYCNSALKDFDFSPKYNVDFIYDIKELSDYETDFFTLMDYKNIYGQAVEEPLIVVENIVITKDNLKIMKANTIKFSLTDNVEAIKFKVSDQELDNLSSSTSCVVINVLGVVEKNSWNNLPQLIVRDIKIINKQEYYF